MPSMAHFANLLIIFQENQKRSYTKNPCLIETIRGEEDEEKALKSALSAQDDEVWQRQYTV